MSLGQFLFCSLEELFVHFQFCSILPVLSNDHIWSVYRKMCSVEVCLAPGSLGAQELFQESNNYQHLNCTFHGNKYPFVTQHFLVSLCFLSLEKRFPKLIVPAIEISRLYKSLHFFSTLLGMISFCPFEKLDMVCSLAAIRVPKL